MSYVDGLLSTGERVIHSAKQHWFVLIWGARYAILGLIVGVILAIVQTSLSSPTKDVVNFVAIILLAVGAAVLIWTFLRYLNQLYILTSRRVIEVEGVLNKKVTDSSLEKINDAILTQSIFGRIFGFGDLEVLTASEAGISLFRMLINPMGFKRAMLDAKHEYERDLAGAGVAGSPPLRAETPLATPSGVVMPASEDTVSTAVPPRPAALSGEPLTREDVTRTLNSLADLRDRGAISEDEFERKKADLLARL
jgi:Bacterial PH domain/Short C-terminal domain